MAESILTRRPDESAVDYHRRLLYAKLIDHTIPEVSFSELAGLLYGHSYAEDNSRRMAYGSCRTMQLIDEERLSQCVDSPDAESIMDDIDKRLVELRAEKQKFFDMRASFNRLVRERARAEEYDEILKRVISEGKLPQLKAEGNSVTYSDNDLLVGLNDIHYGLQFDNYWGSYSPELCAVMMNNYADEIIKIGDVHQSENCIVFMNGDAISGNIHLSIQVENKENVISQVMGVSELIAEFLHKLSNHFNQVRFVTVSGNHSRIDKKDDAIAAERLDDLIEWYLNARLKDVENVEIGYGERIDPTMYVINVRGKTFVGVHGDYDPNERHVQALQTMVGKPVYGVLLGHLHHNETNVVQGVRTFMSGSFVGMDDYCISRRIFGKPEQMVLVCDENGVRCTYNVDLSIK